MALVALQLVPLPPSFWTALPGRDEFGTLLEAVGVHDVWRPLALVPDGALNALSSLLVPLAALLGMSALPAGYARWPLYALSTIVGASALVALIQLSSGSFSNPFINDALDQPAGLFANRNHQALFLNLGILLALGWGFNPSRRLDPRSWAALGFVGLLALLVVATGSRAGLGLLAVACLSGAAVAWPAIERATRRTARWVRPAITTLPLIMAGALILISVGTGRATALDRLFAVEVAGDMRGKAVPTLHTMIDTFFPVGSGLGSFDQMFRMNEPFELLKPSYFNHAHNDYTELLIEAGLAGIMLLICAGAWWATASWRAWRADPVYSFHARLGSMMILLVLLASAVDYPARTPLIMVVLAVAASWLAAPSARVQS